MMSELDNMDDRTRLVLRQIHRAASDMRRGVPVILFGHAPLMILAAETANADGLNELQTISGTSPILILAPARAAAILRTPMPPDILAIAVANSGTSLQIEDYQALSDPTSVQPSRTKVLHMVAEPAFARAAIRLAKIAQLLPSILAVPLTENAASVAAHHGVIGVEAADVVSYAESEVTGLRQVASADVPLNGAPHSRVLAFRSFGAAVEHLAIVIGRPESSDSPLVRIHSECFTGDVLGSLRCDCGEQLRGAIDRIARDGAGIILYLAQEGRGIGLVNKLRAYGLQDRGLDTMDANRALGWDADERNFLLAARMLRLIGIKRVRLLTNNPEKVDAIAACGIEVVDREPHLFAPNGVNDEYLATKAVRFGHLLD
jgi:GTP cyclohydrolase II